MKVWEWRSPPCRGSKFGDMKEQWFSTPTTTHAHKRRPVWPVGYRVFLSFFLSVEPIFMRRSRESRGSSLPGFSLSVCLFFFGRCAVPVGAIRSIDFDRFRLKMSFDWVLPSFHTEQILPAKMTAIKGENTCELGFFFQVLPGFTRLFWVLLGFTEFYRVLLGFTGSAGTQT